MLGCHMADLPPLAGAGAFFALGLAGGAHCAGMCGPLSCLLVQPGRSSSPDFVLYHGARLSAYAVLGALAASLGLPLRPFIPWPVLALVACLPLLIYGFSGREGAPGFLGAWHTALAGKLRGLHPVQRALGLGALSPALPCGLLYAAAAAASAAPGWRLGVAWMLAFGSGTLPWLAAAQAGFGLAARSCSPAFVQNLRRGAALLAAMTILLLSLAA
jgi:uncharacterized protein